MDPSRVEALKQMSLPETADELCEFVHCCRWMAVAIPDFVRRVAPLVALLESAYTKAGRRTKRSIRGMPLRTLSWGTTHEAAFRDLQDNIRNAVQLSYPRDGKVICVFTDASQRYWSGVVTQTDPSQLALPVEKQAHEPLAFLGSAFKDAQLNWSTFEQEGYAIFQTFDKVDYLFLNEQPVHVFTDHRNLLFVFAPLAMEPTLGRHVVTKVQRWALFLSRFENAIEHIDGSKNVFADILTRWTKGYRNVNKLGTPRICSLLTTVEQVVPSPEDIVWPSMEVIGSSQRDAVDKPSGLRTGADGLMRLKELVWIPECDVELKFKLLIVSHCGSMGHRGKDSTESVLREDFTWNHLSSDVASFVQGCLHCIMTRTGEVVPRPLGHALHGDRPNEVLHMDYLYMGASTGQQEYLLVIRDDLSSYVWLWPTESATSEAAADALTTWIAVFGTMDWIVSDQGSHFKNRLIKELTEELMVKQHFTTAYSPWANGSVERVCREVLRACRAVLLEFRLAQKDWPAVTECVQSVINQAPLKRLGLRDSSTRGVYRTPLEVFTAHRPTRPLLAALPVQRYKHVPSLSEARARQLIDIDRTQESLEEMHRNVKGLVSKSRARAVAKHNAKTNVQAANFGKGDFVLVRRAQRKGHKLQFVWRGPRRVTEVKSAWVCEVEDLIHRKRETVHARRLVFYRAGLEDKEVDPILLRYAEHSETTYQDAKQLCDIRKGAAGIEVLVEWEGLPDKIDLTWEPLGQVTDDLPGILQDFLHTSGKRNLKKEALQLCSFK